MDVRTIQEALNAKGAKLDVDGIPGKGTRAAMDSALKTGGTKVRADWAKWPDYRKLVAIEQLIYLDLGIDTGIADGLVGEQTRFARSVYDARGDDKTKPVPGVEAWRDKEVAPEASSTRALTRAQARARWPKQSDVIKFYGNPGSNFVELTMPFPLRIAYEPGTTIAKVAVHRRCKDAFDEIWKRTLDHYGLLEIQRLRLDRFGGCANVRRMRGGSAWSMHAFACAWDVDPDRNQLTWNAKQATLDDPPYKPFWDIVYDAGGLSLGKERDFDHMHWQLTSDLSAAPR